MIHEYDFLDSNQLRQMISLFDAGKFVDGAKSGPKDKEVKDNTQQDDIEINKMVNTGIAKIMRSSEMCKEIPLNKCSPCFMLFCSCFLLVVLSLCLVISFFLCSSTSQNCQSKVNTSRSAERPRSCLRSYLKVRLRRVRRRLVGGSKQVVSGLGT